MHLVFNSCTDDFTQNFRSLLIRLMHDQTWIEAVTGEPFAQPFAEELKDGSKLCNFINCIKAGTSQIARTMRFRVLSWIASYVWCGTIHMLRAGSYHNA